MGVPWETVTLTAFGRDKNMYFSILEEGMYECVAYITVDRLNQAHTNSKHRVTIVPQMFVIVLRIIFLV
jgi:hypothetical protein